MSTQSQDSQHILYVIKHITEYSQEYIKGFLSSCKNLSNEYNEILIQTELIRDTSDAFTRQFQAFERFLNPSAIIDRVNEDRLREFIISSYELNTSLTLHVPHLISVLETSTNIIAETYSRFQGKFTPDVVKQLPLAQQTEVSNTQVFINNILGALPVYNSRLVSFQSVSQSHLTFLKPFYLSLYFPINSAELQALIEGNRTQLETIFSRILDLQMPVALKIDDLAQWSTDASKSLFLGRILRWQTSLSQDLPKVSKLISLLAAPKRSSSTERMVSNKVSEFIFHFTQVISQNNVLKGYIDRVVSSVNRHAATHLSNASQVRAGGFAGSRAGMGFSDNVPILEDDTDAVTTLPDYRSANFEHLRQGFCPYRPLNGVPNKLYSNLFKFQLAGIDFVHKRRGRALIGDEMGCGKTLQAIGSMCMYVDEWPVLLIVPPTLRYNWVKEILTWCSEFIWPENVVSIESSNQQFPDLRRGKHVIVVVSYGIATSLQAKLLNEPFGVIVCDESHYLKSSKASRTKAIIPLIKTIPRAILLSGTPIISRPEEIFTQIHALKPKIFTHFNYFKQRYDVVNRLRALEEDAQLEDLQLQIKQTRELLENGGNASLERTLNALERQYAGHLSRVQTCHYYLKELNAMLKEYVMVRRLKKDVLSELKGKTRTVVNTKIERSAENERVFRLYQRILTLLPHAVEALKKYTNKKSIFASRTAAKDQPDSSSSFTASLAGNIPMADGDDNDDDDDDDEEMFDENGNMINGSSDSVFNSLMNQEDEQLIQILERQVSSQSGLDHQQQRALIVKLFQLTGILKIPFVRQYVDDLLESGVKFLIFAHHIAILDSIQELLEKRKVGFFRVDGSVSIEERQLGVEAFQKRSDVRVALLSITAAGLGLTLTAANVVVFTELYWTPSALIQAEDRCHRVGQNEAVSVYYLLADDSLDSHIWPLVQQKFEASSIALDGFKDKTFQKVQILNENANLSINKIAALSLMASGGNDSDTTTATTAPTSTALVQVEQSLSPSITTTSTMVTTTTTATSSSSSSSPSPTAVVVADPSAPPKVPVEMVGRHLQKRGIRNTTELYNRWKTNASYTRRKAPGFNSNQNKTLVDHEVTLEGVKSEEADAKKERFKYHILRVNNKRQLGLPLGVIPYWSSEWHTRLYTYETFDSQYIQQQRAINTSFGILMRDARRDLVSSRYLSRTARDEMGFASTHLIRYSDPQGLNHTGFVEVVDLPQHLLHWPSYPKDLPDDDIDLDIQAELHRVQEYRKKYPKNVSIYASIEQCKLELAPLEEQLSALQQKHEDAIKYSQPTIVNMHQPTPAKKEETSTSPLSSTSTALVESGGHLATPPEEQTSPFSDQIRVTQRHITLIKERITDLESQIDHPFMSLPNGIPVTHSVQVFEPYVSSLHPPRLFYQPFLESVKLSDITVRIVEPHERPIPVRPNKFIPIPHSARDNSYFSSTTNDESSFSSPSPSSSKTSSSSTDVVRHKPKKKTSTPSFFSIDSSSDDECILVGKTVPPKPQVTKKPQIIESISRASLLDQMRSRGIDENHIATISVVPPDKAHPSQDDITVLNPRDRLSDKYLQYLGGSSDEEEDSESIGFDSSDGDEHDQNPSSQSRTKSSDRLKKHKKMIEKGRKNTTNTNTTSSNINEIDHNVELSDTDDDGQGDDRKGHIITSPLDMGDNDSDSDSYKDSLVQDTDSPMFRAQQKNVNRRHFANAMYIPDGDEDDDSNDDGDNESNAQDSVNNDNDDATILVLKHENGSSKKEKENQLVESTSHQKHVESLPFWNTFEIDDSILSPKKKTSTKKKQQQQQQQKVEVISDDSETNEDNSSPHSVSSPNHRSQQGNIPNTTTATTTTTTTTSSTTTSPSTSPLASHDLHPEPSYIGLDGEPVDDSEQSDISREQTDLWTLLAHQRKKNKPSQILLKSLQNPLFTPSHPLYKRGGLGVSTNDDKASKRRKKDLASHRHRSNGVSSQDGKYDDDDDDDDVDEEEETDYDDEDDDDDDDDDDSLDGFIASESEDDGQAIVIDSDDDQFEDREHGNNHNNTRQQSSSLRASHHSHDVDSRGSDSDDSGTNPFDDSDDHNADTNVHLYSQQSDNDDGKNDNRITFGAKGGTRRNLERKRNLLTQQYSQSQSQLQPAPKPKPAPKSKQPSATLPKRQKHHPPSASSSTTSAQLNKDSDHNSRTAADYNDNNDNDNPNDGNDDDDGDDDDDLFESSPILDFFSIRKSPEKRRTQPQLHQPPQPALYPSITNTTPTSSFSLSHHLDSQSLLVDDDDDDDYNNDDVDNDDDDDDNSDETTSNQSIDHHIHQSADSTRHTHDDESSSDIEIPPDDIDSDTNTESDSDDVHIQEATHLPNASSLGINFSASDSSGLFEPSPHHIGSKLDNDDNDDEPSDNSSDNDNDDDDNDSDDIHLNPSKDEIIDIHDDEIATESSPPTSPPPLQKPTISTTPNRRHITHVIQLDSDFSDDNHDDNIFSSDEPSSDHYVSPIKKRQKVKSNTPLKGQVTKLPPAKSPVVKTPPRPAAIGTLASLKRHRLSIQSSHLQKQQQHQVQPKGLGMGSAFFHQISSSQQPYKPSGTSISIDSDSDNGMMNIDSGNDTHDQPLSNLFRKTSIPNKPSTSSSSVSRFKSQLQSKPKAIVAPKKPQQTSSSSTPKGKPKSTTTSSTSKRKPALIELD